MTISKIIWIVGITQGLTKENIEDLVNYKYLEDKNELDKKFTTLLESDYYQYPNKKRKINNENVIKIISDQAIISQYNYDNEQPSLFGRIVNESYVYFGAGGFPLNQLFPQLNVFKNIKLFDLKHCQSETRPYVIGIPLCCPYVDGTLNKKETKKLCFTFDDDAYIPTDEFISEITKRKNEMKNFLVYLQDYSTLFLKILIYFWENYSKQKHENICCIIMDYTIESSFILFKELLTCEEHKMKIIPILNDCRCCS